MVSVFRRRRPAPPRFPTTAALEAQGGPWATCVCGNTITPWPYPGQGKGTCGDGEWWWVHLGTARRSHTRDTQSAYFHLTEFAHPEDED